MMKNKKVFRIDYTGSDSKKKFKLVTGYCKESVKAEWGKEPYILNILDVSETSIII